MGTCHLDINGPVNLYKLIAQINPNIVAIEGLNPEFIGPINDKWNYDEILTRIKIKIPNMTESQYKLTEKLIKEITALMGYELRIVEKYTKDNNIPIEYIDKDCINNDTINYILEEYINTYVALFNKYCISQEIDYNNNNQYQSVLDKFTEEIRNTMLYFRFLRKMGINWNHEMIDKLKFVERDEYMFNKLLSLIENYSNIMLVCGSNHMNSIYDMFKKQNSELYKLETYDLFMT